MTEDSQIKESRKITPKILIVDDDALNIKLLSAVLSGRKYEILLADSGTKAIEIIHEKHSSSSLPHQHVDADICRLDIRQLW